MSFDVYWLLIFLWLAHLRIVHISLLIYSSFEYNKSFYVWKFLLIVWHLFKFVESFKRNRMLSNLSVFLLNGFWIFVGFYILKYFFGAQLLTLMHWCNNSTSLGYLLNVLCSYLLLYHFLFLNSILSSSMLLYVTGMRPWLWCFGKLNVTLLNRLKVMVQPSSWPASSRNPRGFHATYITLSWFLEQTECPCVRNWSLTKVKGFRHTLL